MTTPLSVSDDQLAMIMRACAPLLLPDRDPFLRAVANALSAEPQPLGDGAVFRAIKSAQKQYFKPPQLDQDFPARHGRRKVGTPLA